ncbi:MAG: threonine--tRNA ligase [Candidatus Harrisonbacteria bacterium CG10_big_fil_rev_8_21_14_0_10_49_15]|uniref:Threonine--tRNA ligase n=1 Tax=Candidatus Harrisonbacteria bacterium CG10_big_fil_rev_8_21_14_0_10_49_15 TaxID=1974587 RepID=A0A2H0UL96_9BACT|nr:MAG: threonine--tRNA ligase [Candidatus Harrisonbacteria bacterium CG10_big_fil_rev_8_21_14_0_10_49_15]
MNNNEHLEVVRHSFAHLLAAAVLELYPEAKPTIGPAIENGFYYDFHFASPISETDLGKMEKKMRGVLRQWEKSENWFSKREVSAQEAKEIFKGNEFKLELIEEIVGKGEPITLYTTGEFTDLCRGGHADKPAELNPEAFKLTHLAGAYWRGDEKNPMLTRIYGVAFETKEELEQYLAMVEEAKKRDHKKLGPELDLFTFSPLVGAGLPLWTPKGTLVRDLLDDFVWALRKEAGYEKVEIPHITKKDLYETSGHWDKFKDELFRIQTREGHEFAMKPMNCPHHTQIYARKKWSYRELPQRYANTTTCYRDEQSGELAGLSRVRAFAQDDAHVFCRMSDAKQEFLKVWEVVYAFYSAFGFSLRVRLSLHDPKAPEKYLGDEARWVEAEKILRDIVSEQKVDWFEGVGEAAFYGPKLDFMAKDAIGRQWQVATIQLDMNMPERFDLTCVNEKGENERIVMIHAAIMGSIERFLSILIEHTAGAFPLWLSPVQARVIAVSDKFQEYASKQVASLKEAGIRVELTEANETLGKRIREAQQEKIPYILVVGEKEQDEKTVAVRHRSVGDLGTLPVSELVEKLQKEIKDKAL